ncbi:Alpha/Beta hydrolase protein [Umbelopsis sp. PMI_123]|nr:Alpha/Beta hydrolase protein [Umbelopsis sp. PMI_123]
MGYLHYLVIKLKFVIIRGISELVQLVLIRARLPGPQLKQSIPGSAPQYASFFFPPSYANNSGRRYPVYIHIHGGGFIGGWTCEDRQLCHYIAQNVDCIVISIAYRFAPEYPYPTGLHDCEAAVKWILQEYQPTKVAVGGLSAGGTLALGLVQLFKDTFSSVIAAYSVYDFSRGSHHMFKEQNPLRRNMFHEAYLLNTKDLDEELRNPLLSVRYIPASLLPESVVIIAAEHDPNIRDMELFGRRVQSERPSAIYKFYPGALHGFMNLPDFALPKAMKDQKWDAFNLITSELKRVLADS